MRTPPKVRIEARNLVIVRWGEARQEALACRLRTMPGGDRVRVMKWKPDVKFGQEPRDWSLPKTIPATDVVRAATAADLVRWSAERCDEVQP